MSVEDKLTKIIEEIEEILEENVDIGDEDWYRILNDVKIELKMCLYKLEEK